MPRDTQGGKQLRNPAGQEAETPRVEASSRPADPGDAATDRWLGQQLRRLYDDVASEPIPDEFLSILARMKGRKTETDPSS